MDVCKKYFPTWQYCNDLDKDVTANSRTAQNGAYAVWLRDRVEADEDTANQSANDLDARNFKGNTLLERILMELEYFDRTGQHLDIQNVTLCTGSRNSDGHVPHCSWCDGKFCVNACRPDYSNSHLRAREEVSRVKVPRGELFSLQIREPSGGHFGRLYNFILQEKVFLFFYHSEFLAEPDEPLADGQHYPEFFYWAYFCGWFRKCGFYRERQTFKRPVFHLRV